MHLWEHANHKIFTIACLFIILEMAQANTNFFRSLTQGLTQSLSVCLSSYSQLDEVTVTHTSMIFGAQTVTMSEWVCLSVWQTNSPQFINIPRPNSAFFWQRFGYSIPPPFSFLLIPTWYHVILLILLFGQQPHLFSTMLINHPGRVAPLGIFAIDFSLQQLEYACIFFKELVMSLSWTLKSSPSVNAEHNTVLTTSNIILNRLANVNCNN